MYKKQREIVETMQGQGKLYDEYNEFVATVMYDIKVEQNVIISDTQKTPGLKTVSGRIEIQEGEKDLITEDWGNLTLRLDNDRTLTFFIKHGDPYSGAYQILGSGKDLR